MPLAREPPRGLLLLCAARAGGALNPRVTGADRNTPTGFRKARHAKLLESYPEDRLTVQGNCDERGGREYNLALGQRRADAVKERLVLLGVPPARIDTVSYGKEKPRLTCHEEKCWQENRRDDFVDLWR